MIEKIVKAAELVYNTETHNCDEYPLQDGGCVIATTANGCEVTACEGGEMNKLAQVGAIVVQVLVEEAPEDGCPPGSIYVALGCRELVTLDEFNAIGTALQEAGLIEVQPGPRWVPTKKAKQLIKTAATA